MSKPKSKKGARASRVPRPGPTPGAGGAVKAPRSGPEGLGLDGDAGLEHPAPRIQTTMFGPDEIRVDLQADSDTQNTPRWLVELAVCFFGGPPDVDPCTNAHALMPAQRRYTIADDGLAQVWGVDPALRWIG